MINVAIEYILVFTFFLAMSIGGSVYLLRVLDRANLKEENFLKQRIVTSSGLVLLAFLVIYGPYLVLIEDSMKLKGWPFSLLIIGLGTGLIGFFDDLFGDHDVSGFKGHFGALAKGKVTTGALKAIIGFALAAIVAVISSSGAVNIIVNTLIVALSINFLNLLDLRPGRSLKVFILASIIVFSFSKIKYLWVASLPMFAPVIVLLYFDLKLKAMLGDAGANILGGLVGLYVIYSFGLKINLGVLLGLIIVHLYAEKHSISAFISKNRFLSWFDNLGLKKPENISS